MFVSELPSWLLRALIILSTGVLYSFAQETKEPAHYHPKAAELVIQGTIYDLNGQYQKALNVYNEALIYDPYSASICYAIAKDYILLGKVETAIEMLKRSSAIDPTFIESQELLATIYHRKGDWQEAEIAYKKVIALNRDNIEAYRNLAAIYLSRDRIEDATALYQELLNKGKADREIHFQLGKLYAQNKEYEQAQKIFKQFIRDYPNEEQGYLAIGALYVAQEDTVATIEWYKQVLEKNGSFKTVREELANTYIALSEWDAAIQLYESNETENVYSDMEAKLMLGDLYFMKGDTAHAVDIYTKFTESYTEEWQGYYKLGLAYASSNRINESVANLKKALELNENIPDAWLRLGIVQQQDGHLIEAEEHFRKAQQLAPRHPWTNFYLGNILYIQKQYKDAIRFLNKSLQNDGDNANTIGLIAAAYDEMGDYSRSEEYYSKALKLDPENPTLLNNYSYSLSVRGERLQEALEMVSRALAAEPDNAAFLDTIGWIHYKLGNYEQAAADIERSLEIRDDSAEVHEHLGDVYYKMGRLESAVKQWQTALEFEPDRESVLKKLKDSGATE